MSLFGFLSKTLLRHASEINGNSQIKSLVLKAPDTIVGKFISDKENKDINECPDATIIRSKKKVQLVYDLHPIGFTLSDVQIEIGYSEESNEQFEIIKCLGFFDAGIGEAISIDSDRDIDRYTNDAWLYKQKSYNYASINIHSFGKPEEIIINSFENILLVNISLSREYIKYLIEQFDKNKLCSISIQCGLYRDKQYNKYYISGLTYRQSNEVRFVFHASEPALTLSRNQVEGFLLNYA